MFHDEFHYRPKFNPFFRTLCMKFEGDDDDDLKGGGGGGGEEHWLDKPEYADLKDNQYLRRFKTEVEAHKGHFETKQALGDPLRLPKSLGKITAEQRVEWEANVAKLRGIPDEYELVRPTDFPESIGFNEDAEKAVKEFAKANHVPQATIQGFYDIHNDMIRQAFEKVAKDNEAAVKATTKELEEELGKKECKEALVLVERLLRSRVNPDWQNIEEEKDEAWQDFRKKIYFSGIGNNPVIMKLLCEVAPSLVGEGKVIGGTPPTDTTKDEDLSEKDKQKKYFPKSPDMVD